MSHARLSFLIYENDSRHVNRSLVRVARHSPRARSGASHMPTIETTAANKLAGGEEIENAVERLSEVVERDALLMTQRHRSQYGSVHGDCES